MQDAYFGDVGDFGKYGLLRKLCGISEPDNSPKYSLGVAWYLTNCRNGNDGKHISYLKESKKNSRVFRDCNRDLYDELQKVVCKEGYRCVKAANRPTILGPSTRFHDEVLEYDQWTGPASFRDRIERREEWLRAALKEMCGCQIVFLDPDNGLEISGVQRHQAKGAKYVFRDEFLEFWKLGCSVIVYQHCDFNSKPDDQLEKRRNQLIQAIKNSNLAANLDERAVTALKYQRGTTRGFLILPVNAHGNVLVRRIEEMLKGPWQHHFKKTTPL